MTQVGLELFGLTVALSLGCGACNKKRLWGFNDLCLGYSLCSSCFNNAKQRAIAIFRWIFATLFFSISGLVIYFQHFLCLLT